jgi:2-C-methyl-D-erythritol 4-phosphate cytidylyltransferase/2-C-methyl-D-erythritol 2,4-cyclodiphosphate synthase
MKNRLLVVIPAAGIGQRFDKQLPKQYSKLNGKSVIEQSVQPFLDSNLVSKVIIAVSESDSYINSQDFFKNEKINIVNGGNSRAQSVLNALNNAQTEDYTYVITHDAARPNILEEDIVNIYEKISSSETDCSIFYIPIVDSIKHEDHSTLDKSEYYLVQTPQISNFSKLRSSLASLLEEGIDIPDESFAMERKGFSISRLKGRSSNIKITHIEDLDLLEKFSTRAGTGFDLHTYKDGKGFLIGGYFLKCDYEIEAHSDGDVLLHSIADSILGASALGDIGIFFSDTDESNKDLDSINIINFCLKKIKELNLEIYNIDATIICESPKISPHRDAIIDSLSRILQISKSKIGLKATTSEKIGIIGKNKAIAVQSLVNLK